MLLLPISIQCSQDPVVLALGGPVCGDVKSIDDPMDDSLHPHKTKIALKREMVVGSSKRFASFV